MKGIGARAASRVARQGLAVLTAAVLAASAMGHSPPLAGAAECPNEGLRTGASVGLPDCRAYELVSPPDANGRLLQPVASLGFEILHDLFPTELASPSKDSVVYQAFQSPLLFPTGPNGNADLYEAVRGSGGWEVERRFTPSGEQAVIPTLGGVSSDHSYTYVHVEPVFVERIGGSLAGEAGADYLSNPDGTFELVGLGDLAQEPLVQGRYISPGGGHVIFSTGHETTESYWCWKKGAQCKALKLESNAAPTGTGTVYDRPVDGLPHVVSLLPNDVSQSNGQNAIYQGSSKDGTSIAFKIGDTLYVRINSGEANEETEEAPASNPIYAGLSDDGKYLFYVEGGEKGTIHRFETESEIDTSINPTAAAEVVNVSADGSHVYFISEEEIGGDGTAGEPNLFVWGGGSIEYIATVAPSDLEGRPALTRWTSQAVAPVSAIELGPGADSSRTTPDGTVLVFESDAPLAPPYDNAGHTEIYRWDDVAEELICLSCAGAPEPATADARLQELEVVGEGMVIHNVSDDGSRVFFETSEALSPADTAGTNDVYQWSEGSLSGPQLISSGKSREYPRGEGGAGAKGIPSPNILFSVTPSGNDVVFMAQDVLVPGAGEGGTEALYDARVNGGFAQPLPPHLCAEEECRTKTGAGEPSLQGERSSSTKGSGNVKPKHRCHKAKGKKKQGGKARRCARKHGKKHHSGKKRAARISARSSAAPAPAAPVSGPANSPEQSSSQVQTPATSTSAPTTRALKGDFNDFGIESLSGSLSTTAAAAHPDFTVDFALTHGSQNGKPYSDAHAEEIKVSLPPGLLGNPNALPRCDTGEFVAYANCPIESQVGIAKALISNQGLGVLPIYNLTPPHPDEEVARFGFYAAFLPVFIDVQVRTASDYGATAIVHSIPSLSGVLTSETILWGNPSDPSHDEQRLTNKESGGNCGTACEAPEGKREVPRTNKAFMTNPSACQGGQLGLRVTSYQLPGQVFEETAPLPQIDSCSGLPFAPSFEATPTSHRAGAATGLTTKLVLPQHEDASERGTAAIREARVTLPAGMAVNPGAANWIDTCSDEQVGYHREIDAACPDGSKLGVATITSPALSQPIEGNLYQRTPTPGHQLGLWLVSDALGLHIKLPAALEPDNKTGRLTAVFSDLPQVPVSEIDLDVWGGTRAPLKNPDSCGTYATDFSFAPHSQDPAVAGQALMRIDEGCNQGFDPKLTAGVADPRAGKYSPLVVDLTRPDGDQALRGFTLTLPDGELAKIKGVPLCPDPAAAAGSCPAGSKIGHVTASAGPGSDPLWVPQPGKGEPSVYLAGPYEGSPFSVVTEVPAQAGPFDLGTVVVRSGLGLDPDTNRAVVKADPLPQFFEGVGLAYRKLHVVVDRPDFSLNPTDCRAMKVNSTVASTAGAIAHPASRFKVNGCKRLKFRPKLSLNLKGGTKRGDYPALTATLKARKGDANIGRASVGLPHSEFLAQEHIVTICTRVQFAAGKCPKGSIYGKAKAWTPLLAKPIEGPVYLRSSSHPLPDLVMAFGGELDVNLVGRIDSHKGGIRSTFESVPDAPVTRFVLKMRGGKKGLLVNSQDICIGRHRATAAMRAQNGRQANLRPSLKAKGCGGKKGSKKRG